MLRPMAIFIAISYAVRIVVVATAVRDRDAQVERTG
jgi:hypothetical protein